MLRREPFSFVPSGDVSVTTLAPSIAFRLRAASWREFTKREKEDKKRNGSPKSTSETMIGSKKRKSERGCNRHMSNKSDTKDKPQCQRSISSRRVLHIAAKLFCIHIPRVLFRHFLFHGAKIAVALEFEKILRQHSQTVVRIQDDRRTPV